MTGIANRRRFEEEIERLASDRRLAIWSVDAALAGLPRMSDVLIGRADRALYGAKRRGRNRIVGSVRLAEASLLPVPMSGAAC